MKIAIIGAGFSGLAVAWELLSLYGSECEITLYDSREIGGGTSGIAAGLLHPFAGAHAKLNRNGYAGVKATQKLLDIASKALGHPVTAVDQGIIRLALTSKQQNDFLRSPALLDPNVEWIDAEICQSLAPGCGNAPGLWIKNGLSIYPQFYLKGLWLACQQLGAEFKQCRINSLGELDDFHLRIITAGAETLLFPELASLSLSIVKGQILEFEWPHAAPPLTCALNSHAYIIMAPHNQSCLVGSTFEKNFTHDSVDIDQALAEIMPKAIPLLPLLREAKLMGVHAGLRAVTPNHLPLLKQWDSRTWVLTGLGSKGLLYHGLMAQELAAKLFPANSTDGFVL